MKRITVIDGHPDAKHDHLTHALSGFYTDRMREAGCEVRRINVAELDFPLLTDPDDFTLGAPPAAIKSAQETIAWADHVAFFYPMWISDVPSLLKAFIEQTFRPGFAMDYGGKGRFPRALLKGRSGRLIVTMGMPAPIYRWVFGAHMLKSYQSALNMCGISPVFQTAIGGVTEDASEHTKQRWIQKIECIAGADAKRKPRARFGPQRIAFGVARVAAAAYLGSVLWSWLRYGKDNAPVRHDALLEGVMPVYEVAVRHRTGINAPVDVTFDALRRTQLERSAIVRALFRTRELAFRAKHDGHHESRALVEEMLEIGWSILAEGASYEIVLGTITQPWKPNPAFNALDSAGFAAFNEPGFAKIALSLRVDPVSPGRCEFSTETRVSTTDDRSRALFRNYWAFLAPGIDLIRRVLLQQIKTEAESRNSAGSQTPASDFKGEGVNT